MEGQLAPRARTCLVCGNTSKGSVSAQLQVCRSCEAAIPWIRNVQCARCGRHERCPDCTRREETYFVQNRSCVRYDEQMKSWLALYKYRGKESLKRVLGNMLVHAYHLHRLALEQEAWPKPDQAYMTFVPLSEERYGERGFNQAEQMAVEVSRLTGIPVLPLLRRTRHTAKQSFKGRADRLDDMQGVFELIPEAVSQLLSYTCTQRTHLYIVDDVYTTGSTLNECARVIRKSLPVQVFGLTFAR
ncbi:ComF family protein [Paenibacillus sp.]|uniref:ComF family protein n=1 Tax=Paenibacillus sp. TaxID=58172 RepID=UPI003569772F